MSLKLRPNLMVIVRYGHHGAEQVAFITRLQSNGTGDPVVRKWRANSGRWTHPVAIRASDVLRAATRDDMRRLQVAWHEVTQEAAQKATQEATQPPTP